MARSNIRSWVATSLAFGLLTSCFVPKYDEFESDAGNVSNSNSGGIAAVGGTSSAGGLKATGGNTNLGGTSGTVGGTSNTAPAGTSATGGAGGSAGSGVTTSVGGTSAAGGSTNVGGNTSTIGGASTTGGAGASGVGGSLPAGGSSNSIGGSANGGGGANGVGGTVHSGGTGNTGGSRPTGGASGLGGTSAATGGTLNAAGGTVSATGGAPPSTGGAPPSTGGTRAATGGAPPATGGAPTGGAPPATGGAPTGGAPTGGAPPATGGAPCTPGPDVLSDFESGKGTLYPVPTANTNGYWYSFKDTTTCTTAQVPASVSGAAVSATALPSSDPRYGACNQYAFHSSIASCPTYSGFGAALIPTATTTAANPVDLSGYDGISFWVKAGAGTQGPLYLEMQSQECLPATAGGSAVSNAADQYNCHGRLLASGTIPTTWTQMFVPFATTGPRWFPSTISGSSGLTCSGSTFCEAPQLNLQHMLSIQFSLEDPFNNTPTVYNSYDVWIDDVAFYRFTDAPTDNGLTQPSSWSASGANPFPQNRAYAGCTKPSSAVGKLIQDAYVAWKANYVTTVGANLKVVSPEIDSGATVSEGMAYGMLIAVYMGDKALFDGLYNYWKANIATGTTTLMNWKVPGGTGGSATDADEDAAFALLEASKQWPSGGYAAAALSMIRDIWTYDIDSSSLLPKGGSTYASANPTNPSYFAPAYYKEFAKVDTGHNWSSVTPSVVSAVYSALNSLGSVSSAGLVPGWCTSNCTAVGNNGAPTDGLYQYDAHRIPWRLGIDACWNGEARAATELGKIVGFFNAQSTSAGLSALGDVYNLNGTIYTLSGANSMSLIGSAGVGAMSVGTAAAFRDRAWQFLLEAQYTNNPIFKSGNASIKAGYTYYNATVGLLAMLTMSGNFYVM